MNRFAIGALAVGLGPSLAAQAESVLVLNSEETSYSINERATRSEMGRLPLGREPHHIAVTPDGKELWITQRFLRRVAVVDLSQMKMVASVRVGKSPHGVFILKGDAVAAPSPLLRAASTEPPPR